MDSTWKTAKFDRKYIVLPWTPYDLLADMACVRMAPLLYTPEGKSIAKKLWDELMNELAFAHARDIVSGFEKSGQ